MVRCICLIRYRRSKPMIPVLSSGTLRSTQKSGVPEISETVFHNRYRQITSALAFVAYPFIVIQLLSHGELYSMLHEADSGGTQASDEGKS